MALLSRRSSARLRRTLRQSKWGHMEQSASGQGVDRGQDNTMQLRYPDTSDNDIVLTNTHHCLDGRVQWAQMSSTRILLPIGHHCRRILMAAKLLSAVEENDGSLPRHKLLLHFLWIGCHLQSPGQMKSLFLAGKKIIVKWINKKIKNIYFIGRNNQRRGEGCIAKY